MSARSRFTQPLGLVALITGIALLGSVVTTIARAHPGARGDRPHPAITVLPPVSIAFGQTVRVTFLNVGSDPVEMQPCIFDGDGAHLKTGDLMTVSPGQMRSFDLGRGEIGGRTDGSVAVRAGVHANRADAADLLVAGEVIEEATGQSSLHLHGLGSPPDPIRAGRVTRSLAPVGIAPGQTLRVTFFNDGRNPLEIVPCVFDGDGAHLVEGAAMTLAPGQMRSIELTWSEASGGRTDTPAAAASGPIDARVQVRGAAHLNRRRAQHLIVSAEMVDDTTGRSSLYVAPGTRNGFDPQPDPPR